MTTLTPIQAPKRRMQRPRYNARVDGPLMSFGASGSIASTITFSRWKGRPYVRQRVVPANPKTALQISVRAVMGFLSSNWAGIGATPQDTWQTLADAIVASKFNAYTKANATNWTQFLAPSQLTPITRTGTIGTTPIISATGGVGQVTLNILQATINDNWGCMIFRGLTGFTTGRGNLIACILCDANASFDFVDRGLAAGTYFYNFRQFTDDGTLGAEEGEETATAT